MLYQTSGNSVTGRPSYTDVEQALWSQKRRTHRAGLRKRGSTSLEPEKKCEHAAAPTCENHGKVNFRDCAGIVLSPMLQRRRVSSVEPKEADPPRWTSQTRLDLAGAKKVRTCRGSDIAHSWPQQQLRFGYNCTNAAAVSLPGDSVVPVPGDCVVAAH